MSNILSFGEKSRVNSLPNDKVLDWSKLKAFSDDKINVTEKFKFDSERIENILGKGENAGYLCYSLQKSGLCGIELN